MLRKKLRGQVVRRHLLFAVGLTLVAPASGSAQDLGGPPDWFVQTRSIVGWSHAPGDFTALPPGATGGDQTSYQPQEYFGAGVGLGRELSLFGLPFRAVVDGSLNFRHDTDVAALPAGSPEYAANLQTLDLRLSLLADIVDLGWGRLYVGGGLGAARVRTEVEIEGTPTSVVETTWKASPSAELGIAFTGFSRRIIPHIGYRFRWIGDVDSGTFATGERLRYSDFHIHDIMFGFKVPLGPAEQSTQALFEPVLTGEPSEGVWTGFHVGAFGGWAKAEDFDVSGLASPAGVPYNAANTYALGGDGAFAGGEIGVDWQWRWLVLGLAGEAGFLGLEDSAADPASAGSDTVTEFSTDWYGAISMRGGLAYENLLAYGRLGAAYLNAEAETTDACTAAPCGAATASASEEDVLFGWFLGAGLEYAFGRHWSVGGEYRYWRVNDDLQPAGTSSTLGAVAQNVGIDRIHVARAGLNFRW